MKLSMQFGSFEVSFDIFLISLGDVRDALVMYLWSSLMDGVSSFSSSATPNSVNHLYAVR